MTSLEFRKIAQNRCSSEEVERVVSEYDERQLPKENGDLGHLGFANKPDLLWIGGKGDA